MGDEARGVPPLPTPHTLIGGPENMKTIFDRVALDIFAAKPYPTAWEQIAITSAQNLVALANRVNNDAASVSHMLNVWAVSSGQTGTTENQNNTSPIAQKAADTQVQQPAGAVYPPNRQVDTGGAAANTALINGVAAAVVESVQTNVTTQISALAGQISDLTTQVVALAAALAQVVQNSKQTA